MNRIAAAYVLTKPIARAATISGRLASRLLFAVYQGIWLGLFDAQAFRALATEYYGSNMRAGTDRDTTASMSREWNFHGLEPWERAAVDAFFAPGSTVLIAACGAGREAFALAADGFTVTAFDCTPALVDRGRRLAAENGIVVRFFEAPPDKAPELGIFDSVIVGWGGYTHISGRATRSAFLRELRAQLRPNGPILVSALHHAEISTAHRWSAAIANAIRRVARRRDLVEPGDEIRDWFLHRFTKGAITLELEGAGFEVKAIDDTSYLHIVGRR